MENFKIAESTKGGLLILAISVCIYVFAMYVYACISFNH